MRTFKTGATRDTDNGKPVFGKFLSSQVLRAFGRYMHKHRIQADGGLRDGDNWKRGMPQDAYFESLFRHHFDLWELHQGLPVFDKDCQPVTIEEACCAILFNVQGYLHEHLKAENVKVKQEGFVDHTEHDPYCVGPCCACHAPASHGERFAEGVSNAFHQYAYPDEARTSAVPTGPSEYEPEPEF